MYKIVVSKTDGTLVSVGWCLWHDLQWVLTYPPEEWVRPAVGRFDMAEHAQAFAQMNLHWVHHQIWECECEDLQPTHRVAFGRSKIAEFWEKGETPENSFWAPLGTWTAAAVRLTRRPL